MWWLAVPAVIGIVGYLASKSDNRTCSLTGRPLSQVEEWERKEDERFESEEYGYDDHDDNAY